MDEKVRYTRYNYKKTKKNSGLAKTILSFLAMSVFVVIVGIMLRRNLSLLISKMRLTLKVTVVLMMLKIK